MYSRRGKTPEISLFLGLLISLLFGPSFGSIEWSAPSDESNYSLGNLVPEETTTEMITKPVRKVICPPQEFPCGNSSVCLNRDFHCDGIPHCEFGEDEIHCEDVFGSLQTAIKVFGDKIFYNSTSDPDIFTKSACNITEPPRGCLCNLRWIFCSNRNYTSVPALPYGVSKFVLNNTTHVSIPAGAFPPLPTLTVLIFEDSVSDISPGAFEGVKNAHVMTFARNSLRHLHKGVFRGLTKLVTLYIEENQLEDFSVDILNDLPNLKVLCVHNEGVVFDKPFPNHKMLQWLTIIGNKMRSVKRNTFVGLRNLESLMLPRNEIEAVDEKAFQGLKSLLEVDLGENKITYLKPNTFKGLRNLTRLTLAGNPITRLPLTLFKDLTSLISLNLSGVEIKNINIRHFRALRSVEYIYFRKFSYCSYAPNVRLCFPKTDGLSSTEHLLVWPILRLSVWVVALSTCAGNTLVLTWRMLSKKEDRVLSLFIKNLSMADFLMGVYLLTVGSLDLAFRDQYNLHAHMWMSSWYCTLCGLVAMVSCEVSVLILLLITVERYRCIKTNVRVVTVTAARYCLAVVWLTGLLLAVFPVLHWPQERAFYSSNGLCFPLHIDDPFMLGWEYSAFVFLGINFLAMLMIIGLYSSMFLIIRDDRQRARPVALKKKEDTILALRLFFIVLTDCMCWIPIILIKILAFADVPISENIYAWVVVFILPINSALNPIIYTLAAPTELRRGIEKLLQRFEKCQKRLECLLTSDTQTSRSSMTTQSLTGTDVQSLSANSAILGSSAFSASSRKFSKDAPSWSSGDDTFL